MRKTMNKINILIPALCISLGASIGLFSGCQDNTLADDAMVQPSDWSEGVMTTDAWVMASIGTSQSVRSDALHLAYSEDGLTWTALNSNNYVFKPTIGTGHIRDPYIFRKNDGSFVLLAADFTEDGQYYDMGCNYSTTYGDNPSNKIYVAFSNNLITWTDEHLLQVTDGTGTNGAERHAWSPRAVYNKDSRCYDIYWTGDNKKGINSTYVTQTYDFVTVHDLNDHILYSPGYSVTGSDIVKGGSKYYLFARDDDVDLTTGSGGNIKAASLDSWGSGEFSQLSSRYINRVDDQKTPVYTEYPCVYQLEDGITWIMLTQKTNTTGSYQILGTTNISDSKSWTDYSGSVTMLTSTNLVVCPTVTRITASELEALTNAY